VLWLDRIDWVRLREQRLRLRRRTQMWLRNRIRNRVRRRRVEGGEWVNYAAPLAIADLRWSIRVARLLDICCINCMHVLPELSKLEHAFPNELVVIGIPFGQVSGRARHGHIREAVLRYEI